jgi:hypothetical protein
MYMEKETPDPSSIVLCTCVPLPFRVTADGRTMRRGGGNTWSNDVVDLTVGFRYALDRTLRKGCYSSWR